MYTLVRTSLSVLVYFKKPSPGVPLVAQSVKYLVLSQLWHRFILWPQNFSMPCAQPKKQNKQKNPSYYLLSLYIVSFIEPNPLFGYDQILCFDNG